MNAASSYIKIPVRWNFDQSSILTCDKWLHPLFCFLLIVNLRPGVTRPEIVWLTVVVAHTVVVLDAVGE